MSATIPEGLTTVADGVEMISHGGVNCYLVDTEDRPVLVDAGLPGSWKLLECALARRGLAPPDLGGVYLTHAHFDHVGMCGRLLKEHRTRTHVHPSTNPWHVTPTGTRTSRHDCVTRSDTRRRSRVWSAWRWPVR